MRLDGTSLLVMALLFAPVFANADNSSRAPKAIPSLIKAKAATGTSRSTIPEPAPAPKGLVVIETIKEPATDYDAEVYSGVPLSDTYARDRGLSKGLVRMVFEKERRLAFRIPHEKIRRVVRLAAHDARDIAIKKRGPFVPVVETRTIPRDRIDIIETDAGYIAIETTTTNAGIFTTSDVYVFPRGATLEQRIQALANVDRDTRERLRNALTLAR